MSILEKYNQQECRQNSCPGCSWVLSEGRQWVLGSLFSPLHHCSQCEQSVPEGKAVPGKILTLLSSSVSAGCHVAEAPRTPGHLKPLTSPGAQCHPERLPKPPGDWVFSGAARGVLQLLRHGQVEQCLGTLDHSRSPAAAMAHYPRARQLSLNIHMGLIGSCSVVSKSPTAAWAG